jgi:formylglycine-generating enzyme required for sulfatase activity
MSPKVNDRFRDAPGLPEMVVVESGEFIMGGSGDDPQEEPDEHPGHLVGIAYSLAVGRFPVTFSEWDLFASQGGTCYFPGDESWGRDRRPVINVSWFDAQAYCKWLQATTGLKYRLLSEAEWEYCALTAKRMHGRVRSTVFDGWSGAGKTQPVGEDAEDGVGLHDLVGNVWQWVEDPYHANYAGAPADGTPWLDGGVEGLHVLRGGSWEAPLSAQSCRFRHAAIPTYRFKDTGFRVARMLETG